MPGVDGLGACRYITRHCKVPVIMVSARTGTEDKVRCLEMGADDYVTKPFEMQELTARVKALLRREGRNRRAAKAAHFKSADLDINLEARRVFVRGKETAFTAREFALLQELVLNADKTLTHAELLHAVWGPDFGEAHEYLHVYIRQLRFKIEQDPHHPSYLVTMPGMGYVLRSTL